MQMVSAMTVRKRFGSIVNEVHDKKLPIAITRDNVPLVIMVPYEEYEMRNSGKRRQEKLNLVCEKMDMWCQKHAKELKGFDSVRAVRQIRDLQ